ncbi:hypothetical protein ACIHFC_01010 [Streptomyces sp. NPDC052013]|uniref:hypothetical protein n=1 Tax=Streptomyces sp. NPDC052013 TaxID=3365679 RepID=UPI0037D7BE89
MNDKNRGAGTESLGISQQNPFPSTPETKIHEGDIKQFSMRPFTQSPRIQVKAADVIRCMTKARKPGTPGSDEEPHDLADVHGQAAGPYLYTPACASPSPDPKGTLSVNGESVVLQVTEPLLAHFFAVVHQLESDLAARWVGSAASRSACRADESITQ